MKRTIISFFSFLVFLSMTVASVSAISGGSENSGIGTIIGDGNDSQSSSSGGRSRRLAPSASTFQKVDPFYLKLFEEGKEAWRQGNLIGAIEKLEVAYFGFLKSPSHLIETGIYLIVCHFEANNHERAAYFDSEISALGAGECLSEFDLPQALSGKYHEARAYFARQKAAGQYHPVSGQDAAPLMKSEALISSPKSPYTRIAELEQLIERDRNNTAAYLEIASIYLQYENPKMAKMVLRKLLEIDPDNAAGRFELGKAYLALEEYREAVAELTQAASVLDGDIEFHYQKGAAHYMIREFDAARREFERVRSLHAGYKLTEDYLIELERLIRSESVAESTPAEPAVSRPSSRDESELTKKQIEQTKPQTQMQAMQAQASPAEQDYLELARREGKLKKKIQYYIEALRLDPSQIDIYFEMTEAYRAEKKYREAAGLLEYLLQYIPDDHRIYVELADLYVLCKYYDKAIDFCEQGLTLYPDDLDISYGLARAYMGKKRYTRAASEFRKIIQLSPEFKDAPSLFETCRKKIK